MFAAWRWQTRSSSVTQSRSEGPGNEMGLALTIDRRRLPTNRRMLQMRVESMSVNTLPASLGCVRVFVTSRD